MLTLLSLGPRGLLVAAVVAAIPLGGECIGFYQRESFAQSASVDDTYPGDYTAYLTQLLGKCRS